MIRKNAILIIMVLFILFICAWIFPLAHLRESDDPAPTPAVTFDDGTPCTPSEVTDCVPPTKK